MILGARTAVKRPGHGQKVPLLQNRTILMYRNPQTLQWQNQQKLWRGWLLRLSGVSFDGQATPVRDDTPLQKSIRLFLSCFKNAKILLTICLSLDSSSIRDREVPLEGVAKSPNFKTGWMPEHLAPTCNDVPLCAYGRLRISFMADRSV